MELSLNNNAQTPTLCLNMIVKNESKIITRLLDSVVSIIDCYCICDTGSTDNTIELIDKYFLDNKIPGKIVKEPFKNFCHNRNFALQSCIGMSDYVLLMDADMILQNKQFDKTFLLLADSFTILQGNEAFYYQNTRIVRNNGLYHYVGVTHEYINIPPNNKLGEITKDKLFILDLGDGGAKNDKFERDIRLLTEGLKEEPENVRYHFYLANSYYDCGRFEEAIEIYKKRIALKGWIEEVWYSHYRIGLCYQNLDKISDAIYYWMAGYEEYPDRLEGLYEIIKYYRVIGKQKLCSVFYDLSKKILDKNLNRDNYLFLHKDIYTSKIYYEFTIIAAYLGIKNINNEIIQVLNNSLDMSESNNLLGNMKFYKDILIPSRKIILDNTFNTTINNENIPFQSSSSCIIKNPDKTKNTYFMNIRYVNYLINEHGQYLNCEKHIITTNKFIEITNDFQLVNEKWFDLKFDGRLYMGVEDVRIFNDDYTNDLLFIGTGYHKNNNIGIVNGKYNLNNSELIYNEVTPNFCNSTCEKNWVFVDYHDSTHIIYNWHPLNICKINSETNQLAEVEKKQTPLIFSRIRGSTCGFKYIKNVNEQNSINAFNNISIKMEEIEYWFVVHIVSYEQPRHYYHMIVVFDDNLNLLRYSAPFKFEGDCIEYCLGIVVEDERIILSYSNWDRTTRLGIYDKKYIDSIIKFN